MADITIVHDADVERRGDGSAPADVGGDFRDVTINEAEQDTNYGTRIYVGPSRNYYDKPDDYLDNRSLHRFDLNRYLPASATITAAVWHVYKSGSAGAPGGTTYRIVRILRDWVEDEATWNAYSSGNAWTVGGAGGAGDRDGTEVINLGAMGSGTGFHAITMTSFVQHAWTDHAGILNFIWERYDANLNESSHSIYAKEQYAANRAQVHQLRVTYTLPNRRPQIMTW